MTFQDQYEQHADALRGLIKNNKGTPVAEKAASSASVGDLAAASIEGDETMHWAVLRNALGMDPVPVAFIA